MRRRCFVYLLPVIICILSVTRVWADTMHTQDGKEIKGIVLEDYKDRIIMSTADGEVSTLKSDIKQLYYDGEADNLIKLAEQARERGDMLKAFAYYDMAYKYDPNSKVAKDGIVFLQGYLFRKEQIKKEDEIKKQEEFEQYGSAMIQEENSYEEKIKNSSVKLQEVLGITLSIDNNIPVVDSVNVKSPAYEAGIQRGDAIVLIWGRLCGYMPLEDIIYMLLEKSSIEIKCEIERAVPVRLNFDRTFLSSSKDIVGASFRMEFDGLTVGDVVKNGPAFEAGLQRNDLVVSIDGISTRYMPLKKAILMIRSSRNNNVTFRIKREVQIWRKP